MIFTAGRSVFTASETPARHNDRVEIGHLRHDLESGCALPGDDGGIVVAVDVGEPFFLPHFMRVRFGLGKIFPVQNDGRAQFLAIVDLNEGRELRHHDSGRYA